VAVHDINFLPYDNPSEEREKAIEGRQGAAIVKHQEGEVVHLEPIGEHPDSLSIPIRVGDNDDLLERKSI